MEPGAIHLLRWALYADLGLLFGMSFFAIYNPGAKRVPRKFLWMLAGVGIFLTLASLQLTAAAMADASAMRVDPQLLALVIGQTGFGQAAIVRLALLSALVPVSLIVVETEWPAALLGGAALLTLAWGGHGSSTPETGGAIHLAADLIHLLAAGTWLGALAMFLRLIPGEPEMCYSALRRFSVVGTSAVIALVVSGAVNAAYQIDFVRRGWGPLTTYESLLVLKLVLFGGMLMLATINRFLLTPSLASHGSLANLTRTRRALRRSISIEFAVAFAVLALVGWLGTLDPGA